MVHLSSTGSELSRSNTESNGSFFVSVNPADGSCWVACGSEIVHFAVNGSELWQGENFRSVNDVSVNPTDGSCWATDAGAGQVVHLAAELLSAAANPSIVGPGGTTSLSASYSDSLAHGTATYAWSDGGAGGTFTPSPSVPNPTYTAPAHTTGSAHTLTLQVSAHSSDEVPTNTSYAATTLTLSSTVVASAGGNATIASGGHVTLQGSASAGQPPYAYSWSPTTGLDHPNLAQPTASPSATTTYTLTVTDSLGQQNSSSVTITVASAVVAQAGPDRTLLSGGSVPLQGSASGGLPPYTYSWSPTTGLDNPALAQPTASPSATTTYTLTVTDNLGQTNTDTVTITVLTFSDVPPSYWAYPQVMACVLAGVVNGYSDGTYRPTDGVTRDQMAIFVSRALAGGDGNVPAGPATAHFPDVPTSYWAFKYVAYAYANGIVQGYPDGAYDPGATVNRAQMAVFTARAMATPPGEAGLVSYTPPTTPSFTDVPTGFWSFKYVEYLKAQGVVNGYSDGTYHPEYTVTRDQMAVYIARAFHLTP